MQRWAAIRVTQQKTRKQKSKAYEQNSTQQFTHRIQQLRTLVSLFNGNTLTLSFHTFAEPSRSLDSTQTHSTRLIYKRPKAPIT